jgi:SpoVK/Ycf46/Vps4 family AAA+-type ATPase
MPTAEQLRSLIKAHFEQNNERFTTIVLQIAAHEAKNGHIKLADDIKNIIDKSKLNKPKTDFVNSEILDFFIQAQPTSRLSDMVLPPTIIERLKRIENEYLQRDKLKRHNYTNRRKILLSGPPGTGKTMSAYVLANELGLQLNIIMMDKIVTKFMGETSMRLRKVFDYISQTTGVYLFDEFDAIGAERSKDNDVGEMRRVLNSFLQFIERDDSDSIIIAATNNLLLLDQALFRRFDDVLHYQLPDKDEKVRLIINKLGAYLGSYDIANMASDIGNLSHAEIVQACNDAVKEAILHDEKHVNWDVLVEMLEERKSVYQ